MKISVGNLPQSLTDEALKKLFSEFGKVESVSIKKDKKTGVSLGYGSVEMEDDAGHQAIEKLNGKELEGKKIAVVDAESLNTSDDKSNKDKKTASSGKIHGGKGASSSFNAAAGVRRSGGGGRGK
jgi:RNA recognition motif-containing protein